MLFIFQQILCIYDHYDIVYKQNICNPVTSRPTLIKTWISNGQLCFLWPIFGKMRCELYVGYQIPTVQAVHILSTDISNPQGSVAKQVTVCFKSLPDASFSQTQMKNRRGPLDFPEKPIWVWWWNKPCCSLQRRWKLIYWHKQQH